MNDDFNPTAIALACNFYSRAFTFPFDELVHQFHYLFREIEKQIDTYIDNTAAAKVLDVINFYQGEEMSALQAEFARMFTPVEDEPPFISLQLEEYLSPEKYENMLDDLREQEFGMEHETETDSISNVLDYFSYLLTDDISRAKEFWEEYLATSLPLINKAVYDGTTLNFYKEASKGLNELVFLLQD